MIGRRAIVLAAVFLASFLPTAANAHVIPNVAFVKAFVAREGSSLRVLVRVPLSSMTEATYPTRGAAGLLLDMDRADEVLHDLGALWVGDNLEFYEDDVKVADPEVIHVQPTLALDGSFASYEQARAHLSGAPLTNSVDFVWDQGLLDVELLYKLRSATSLVALHSKLSRLSMRTSTGLRYLKPDGSVTAYDFVGDPGTIRLDPTWRQAATDLLRNGFNQVLFSLQIWLFAAALAIPLRTRQEYAASIIAFAAGIAAVLTPTLTATPDTIWIRPLLTLLMAAAIIFLSIENLVGAGRERRWVPAFLLGLAVGIGGSLGLRDGLQFAASHQVLSFFAFGLGNVLAYAVLLTALLCGLRGVLAVTAERIASVAISLVLCDVALGWAAGGWGLLHYRFTWASPAAGDQTVVRWVATLLTIVVALWILRATVGRRRSPADATASHAEALLALSRQEAF